MNKNDLSKYWHFKSKRLLFNKKKAVYLILLFNLMACSQTTTRQPSIRTNQHEQQQYTVKPSYVCQLPESYAGRVVGDGECVSLIKLCSAAPNTEQWSAGANVLSQTPGSIMPGTIIATFKKGKYPSETGYHAAIYISHNHDGIWVWDQWSGMPVHKRLIRVRQDKASASNTAQAYRIVR